MVLVTVLYLQDECRIFGTWFPYLQNEGMKTVALNQGLGQNHLDCFLTCMYPGPAPGGDSVSPGCGPHMCVFPGDLMQISSENSWTRGSPRSP